ncbi:MAG: DUF433 domain-containing protein [Verrucomicrobiales bacterium]|nr:DUF433 domain-containing protein [Verrucomicrobiales bacterium]MCP5524869.1 DUF433 domain-containing protein [Verrucomicrobiales bacterium]
MRIVLDPEDLKALPVSVDPEVLGGKPVFAGTRVPLQAFWSNLADGATLDQFLEWFPTVSRQQAEVVLRHALRTLAQAA